MKLLKRFLLVLECTTYGPKDEYLFEATNEKWPCIVKLLGGRCPSARGSRLVAAFKHLRGMQKHMRTTDKVDLLEYAKNWLRENSQFYYGFESDFEGEGSQCPKSVEQEEQESYEPLTSKDRA